MALVAPKCRLCGEAHWASEPHAFGKAPAQDARDETIKTLRAKVKALEAELRKRNAVTETVTQRVTERAPVTEPVTQTAFGVDCAQCGKQFAAKTRRARFCSPKCRVAHYRKT